MNNYQTWLETPNIVRIALVQAQAIVGGVLTTRYISTHSVIVDGIDYLPIIRGTISIDESISTSYAASISYGDIELANNNGEYDSWLDDIWGNKSIRIYIGELPQPGATSVIGDFELVFDGMLDDIDSKSRSSLNLKLRDKLEKLNTSVSEALLGNYYHGQIVAETVALNQYRNSLKPLCFGEVHNITPLLTDPSMLEYMVNLEGVEQVIEVRDSGVPVPFTTIGATLQLPAGSFRLLRSPTGTVTCSVQGMKRKILDNYNYSNEYLNTAANAIATIIKLFGNQTGNYVDFEYVLDNYITDSDILLDMPSFSTLGTQAIGLYLTDRVNVLTICQDLAKSCGLILTTTRLGTLRLVELDVPTTASINITESDMLLNTLAISQRLEVIAGVRLGYAKNWTVQANLLTSIPQQHKDMYATEWLESTQSDSVVANNYSTTIAPALEYSYLIDKAQADTVSLKKLNLFKTKRKIITMTCTAKMLSVQVGDAVRVTAARFGLSGGALGRVVSTKPNWLRGTIEIGVLI
jgi:hypothetical protein